MATLIRVSRLPDQNQNPVDIRILMTGDYYVGKTTLLQAFLSKQHLLKQKEEYEPNWDMNGSVSTSTRHVSGGERYRPLGWKQSIVACESRRILHIIDTAGRKMNPTFSIL